MKNKINKAPELFICECHSTDHQIIILYSEDDGYPIVYSHVHLNERPFWERLKYGIKYIFGYKSRYGAFDEFIINPKDAKKIEDILIYLKKTTTFTP